MSGETLLSISGPGIQPYSARGLSQSLVPISAKSQVRRTVNGTLIDVSDAVFEKYSSTISCTDQTVPALNDIWPGDTLTVDCVAELCYLTATGSPTRTVVSGSSRVDGAYTFYRPQLTMMVLKYDVRVNEYGAEVGWQLELEEV